MFNDLIFLPYLNYGGTISPFFNLNTKAEIYGLLPHHTRDDILYASYQGLCLSIKDCYDALNIKIKSLTLSGGASKSIILPQILSDILGVKIIIPTGEEFGARGAAYLASVAINKNESIKKVVNNNINIKQILVQISFHTIAKNIGISEENLILFWALPSVLASMQLFYYGTYLTHGKDGEIRTTNLPKWLQRGIVESFPLINSEQTLSDKKWDVRLWPPAAQTVLNAFRWNYPGKKHDIILLIHIGEIESFLLGYNQGYPDAIVPLDLGIQNLTDAWKYRSTASKAK